jgi:hypothetical protein
MQNDCWLPCIEEFNDYGGNWKNYEDILYSIFKNDFIDSRPTFEGKHVKIRSHPMEGGKEQTFVHITTSKDDKKDGKRIPDMRRCERMRWVRAFIENYNCDPSKCTDCDGVKIWEEDVNSGSVKRVHLLLEEERFIVVLERRDTYFFLITAFYFEHDHWLRKKVQKYKNYWKTKKP